MAGIVRLFGHAAGGRPSERLMAPLGMPVGHTTILRHVKGTFYGGAATPRVAGIDDWAWKKGTSYATMIVDLERRQVVDVLADRSAQSTAEWSAGTRRSRWSAATGRDYTPMAHDRARHRHGKSRIAFTCCRTFGRPSSGSWVGWVRRSGEHHLYLRTMASTKWRQSPVLYPACQGQKGKFSRSKAATPIAWPCSTGSGLYTTPM
jgi:hypothetical protein